MSMGVEARCRLSKSAAHCHHMKRQPSFHNSCNRRGSLHCHRHHHPHLRLCCRCRCHCRCNRNRNRPSLLLLPWAIAAVKVNHCHCQPLPSLLRCCPPSLSLSPLPSDIAVSVTVVDRSCHCRWPSPSPCCRPFPRVVALARQELYSTNRSKECLPHFILFRQWAAY
jgi:hypothetical protein